MSVSFPKFLLSKPHHSLSYTLYFGNAQFAYPLLRGPSWLSRGFSKSPKTPKYFHDYTTTASFQISAIRS